MLEWFELVTDEFQSNRVSISRVYPCVMFLRNRLLETDDLNYTKVLCDNLLHSLEIRFGSLILKEVHFFP